MLLYIHIYTYTYIYIHTCAVEGPKDTVAADVFAVTFPDYEKYFKYIYPNAPSTSTSTAAK